MGTFFSYITTVSGGEPLGQRRIIDASRIFRFDIDSDFQRFDLVKSAGRQTSKVSLDVLGIRGTGTFDSIFAALPGEGEVRLVTQEEVVWFCGEFPHFLVSKDYNFFPIKQNYDLPPTPDNLFMVMVLQGLDGLIANIRPFTDQTIWRAGNHNRRLIVSAVPDHRFYEEVLCRETEEALAGC